MKYGKKGWLLSLGNKSNWGDISTFFNEILLDTIYEDTNCIIVESNVWGSIDTSNGYPEVGDGIGFYHSSTAVCPGIDFWDKKRRIQMIGLLEELEYEKQKLTKIKFKLYKNDVYRNRIFPLIRDVNNEQLFEAIIPQYIVKGLYKVDENEWGHIVKLLNQVQDEENTKNVLLIISKSLKKNLLPSDILRLAEELIHLNDEETALLFYDKYLRLNDSGFEKKDIDENGLDCDVKSFSITFVNSITNSLDPIKYLQIMDIMLERILNDYYRIELVSGFISNPKNLILAEQLSKLEKLLEYSFNPATQFLDCQVSISFAGLEHLLRLNFIKEDKLVIRIIQSYLSSHNGNYYSVINELKGIDELLSNESIKVDYHNLLLGTIKNNLAKIEILTFFRPGFGDNHDYYRIIYLNSTDNEKIEILKYLFNNRTKDNKAIIVELINTYSFSKSFPLISISDLIFLHYLVEDRKIVDIENNYKSITKELLSDGNNKNNIINEVGNLFIIGECPELEQKVFIHFMNQSDYFDELLKSIKGINNDSTLNQYVCGVRRHMHYAKKMIENGQYSEYPRQLIEPLSELFVAIKNKLESLNSPFCKTTVKETQAWLNDAKLE